MTVTPEIIAKIKNTQHNADKFVQRPRGFVDWSFSELCAYKGYEPAVDYVNGMRRWYNYETQYQGKCLLDITYSSFCNYVQDFHLQADHGHTPEIGTHI